MRDNGTGNTQNPGAQHCGGLPDYYQFWNYVKRNIGGTPGRTLSNMHGGAQHNLFTVLRDLREKANAVVNNIDMRVKYLAKDISEAQLATNVLKRDNIREKNRAMLQILELANTVMVENLNAVHNYCRKNPYKNHPYNKVTGDEYMKPVYEYMKNITDVVKYCNTEMYKLACDYKMKVLYFPKNNFRIPKKMNSAKEMAELLGIKLPKKVPAKKKKANASKTTTTKKKVTKKTAAKKKTTTSTTDTNKKL
jgi:hypothetical protein